MGITGLLPFLKSIQRQVNISVFRGKKVAVDAYCWLHRGAYSCPMELVMGPKEGEKIESLPFLKYCIKRVKMLLDKGVTPIIVFDGSQLPIKSKVEAERRKRRKEYKERGKALLREGKRSEAHDCFQKCIDVSPEMAHAFIKACHKMKVECIVAPYEADSQLAYLSTQGIVDLVITEDSDLLVFGCKKVLFKMDEIGGGFMIDSDDFGTMIDGKLTNFTLDEFRQMCILSGCDYLPSVPGIGLSTAHKLMKKYAKNVNNIIKVLKFDKGKSVPSNYQEQFYQAELTFKHQLVFDPRTQKQVPLTPLPEGTDQCDYDFAGVMVSPCKAVGLARGNINPLTYEVMDTFSPSKTSSPADNSKQKKWSSSGMATSYKHYSTPIQANLNMFSSSEKSRQNFKPPRKTESNDVSSDNATLLSVYSCSNEESGASLMDLGPGTSSDDHVRPSDPTNKPSIATISRFFASQNGHTSCTPHNPFSLPKSKPFGAASAARKLDLSFAHNSSVEGGGEKLAFEESNDLQDDTIDVIEQSPVKELGMDECNRSSEAVEEPLLSNGVAIIELSSSDVRAEDARVDSDNEKDNMLTQSEQGNSTMDKDGNVIHKTSGIAQTTSDVTKKLGHRDLKEFAFKSRSERNRHPSPQNSRSLSLPTGGSGDDNILRTPSRKITSLEDFLCPLQHKKHKTVATESELEESTLQVKSVQVQRRNTDTDIKSHKPTSIKNSPPSNTRVLLNRKTASQSNRSSSFSNKKSKGTMATDRSLTSTQFNLKKYAFATRKENVLGLPRTHDFSRK